MSQSVTLNKQTMTNLSMSNKIEPLRFHLAVVGGCHVPFANSVSVVSVRVWRVPDPFLNTNTDPKRIVSVSNRLKQTNFTDELNQT